jgi:hypothetical protein
MITLESGGMSYSKKIAYSISKIPIPRNERKQTGPNCHCLENWRHTWETKKSISVFMCCI